LTAWLTGDKLAALVRSVFLHLSGFLLFAFGSLGAATAENDPRFAAAARLSAEHDGIALLVMIEGRTVFENYSNGGAADRAAELASGTKSFSGIAALCAVEDGLLTLDEKVSTTISEWRADPARRDITIRQLLTLTSGILGGESVLRGGQVPTYAEAIRMKAVAAPGEHFSYGPAPFQVFGEVLQRKLAAKNETVRGYFDRRILHPLGIKPAFWRSDGDSQPHLPSGLRLTARDWAKFGEMVRLGGKGVVSSALLAESFQGTSANPAYGLAWWLPPHGPVGPIVRRPAPSAAKLPADLVMAAGAGGQRLVVCPSLKLVAVRFAPVRAPQLNNTFDDTLWLRRLVEAARAVEKP
jgi:CubicO group peptidase (beta-lactamase class C family)